MSTLDNQSGHRGTTGGGLGGGPADDRGAATVWVAVTVTVLLAVAVIGIHLGAAVNTRHRVEAAADLAALAAAAAAPAGDEAACRRAVLVAERMRARLRSCRLHGWDSLVEVEAVVSGLLGPVGTADARARAGPVAP